MNLRPRRTTIFKHGAALILLVVRPALAAPDAAATGAAESPSDAAATQFAQTCAGCHTIGGGAARAPDLVGVAPWPDAQLIAVIQTMQRKVGPLDAAAIERLKDLLKDGRARARVEAAKANLAQSLAAALAPADSLGGGALFFGLTPLENGGLPCNSCHRFHGEGGQLGPDLTRVAEGGDVEALAGSIARAGFTVMRGAYHDQPITPQEARHIAAFLQQARAPRAAATPKQIGTAGLFSGIVAFLSAIVYVGSRPRGARTRLIQRATKR